MISIKGLLLFGLLTLLGGCATCPPPGYPTANGDNCWYKLTVTNIDKPNGWVTGEYPPDLIDKAKKEERPTKYTFQVRDLDWLVEKKRLKENCTYYFNNGHGSPFLEAFPEGYVPEEDDEYKTKKKCY